jgi:MoaA/NifB/PqqE/SkfB family radical SAM enzyme
MNKMIQLLHRKSNHLLAELSLRSGLSLNKPTYICAKMTMRCNSHCAHCNIWKMDPVENELAASEWFRILDSLHQWLGRFDMVFTGGEALLRDDMLGILSYAVRNNINVELLSNSIVIDDRMARRIVETGIGQFTTSLDGINAETHDRFRGARGLHAKTLAAISSLCTYRRAKKHPMEILLKTVISSHNVEELADIASFCKQSGNKVLYQPIEQNYGEQPKPDWYVSSNFWIRDIPRLKLEIDKLIQLKHEGYPIANSQEDLLRMIQYFQSPMELMRAIQDHDAPNSSALCRPAVSSFVISSNGDVRLCFKMPPIGNLRHSTPQQIWKNRKRCWMSDCGFR